MSRDKERFQIVWLLLVGHGRKLALGLSKLLDPVVDTL